MYDSSLVETSDCVETLDVKAWGIEVLRKGVVSKPSTLLQWRRFLYYRTTRLSVILQQADKFNDIYNLNMDDEIIEDDDVYLLSVWLAYNRWHAPCDNIFSQTYSRLLTLSLNQCTLSHIQCEFLHQNVLRSKM